MSNGRVLRTFLLRVPYGFQLYDNQGYSLSNSVINHSRRCLSSSTKTENGFVLPQRRNVSRSSSSRNETPPIELDTSSSIQLKKYQIQTYNRSEKSCSFTFNLKICVVKLGGYDDHSPGYKIVAVVDRWLLHRGHLVCKNSKWGLKSGCYSQAVPFWRWSALTVIIKRTNFFNNRRKKDLKFVQQ